MDQRGLLRLDLARRRLDRLLHGFPIVGRLRLIRAGLSGVGPIAVHPSGDAFHVGVIIGRHVDPGERAGIFSGVEDFLALCRAVFLFQIG